jgi:DNA-binding FadR family transcriptional regulator
MEKQQTGIMKKLKPLNTTLRYRAVQDALRTYILENQLQPGDRLPSEAELAAKLGVSRNPIREALKGLEALGLVEVRVGLGAYVKAATLDDILTNFAYSLLFDGQGVADLYEIRQRLELSYVREAVRQLTDENLVEMEGLLAEMQRQFAAGEDFIMQDLALHRVLFGNVGNATLLKLFDIFSAIYANTRHLFQAQTREVVADDLEKHKVLLEALRGRDEDEAYARLQDTYTKLPDLRVDTQPAKVVAE